MWAELKGSESRELNSDYNCGYISFLDRRNYVSTNETPFQKNKLRTKTGMAGRWWVAEPQQII